MSIGMHALKLIPTIHSEGKEWNFLGIFAKNREEWAVADLACVRSSVTIIPFFDSLGPSALSFVIKQTELQTMCVDASGFDNLVKVKPECHSFTTIVTFDDIPEEKL
jgi:long-chain acyl-CoA synthetase